MRESENYGLAIPEGSDAANIEVIGDNFQIIDETMKQIAADGEDAKAEAAERAGATEKSISDLAGNVLQKNNQTPYTPVADYHPSTKKYVDEAVSYENEAGFPVRLIYRGTFETPKQYRSMASPYGYQYLGNINGYMFCLATSLTDKIQIRKYDMDGHLINTQSVATDTYSSIKGAIVQGMDQTEAESAYLVVAIHDTDALPHGAIYRFRLDGASSTNVFTTHQSCTLDASVLPVESVTIGNHAYFMKSVHKIAMVFPIENDVCYLAYTAYGQSSSGHGVFSALCAFSFATNSVLGTSVIASDHDLNTENADYPNYILAVYKVDNTIYCLPRIAAENAKGLFKWNTHEEMSLSVDSAGYISGGASYMRNPVLDKVNNRIIFSYDSGSVTYIYDCEKGTISNVGVGSTRFWLPSPAGYATAVAYINTNYRILSVYDIGTNKKISTEVYSGDLTACDAYTGVVRSDSGVTSGAWTPYRVGCRYSEEDGCLYFKLSEAYETKYQWV